MFEFQLLAVSQTAVKVLPYLKRLISGGNAVRVLMFFAAAVLLTHAAQAGHHYGMAGCGLGSIVMKKNNKMMQIFAATTNGTSGNQTFGITSGTSNCKSGKEMAAIREQQQFVASNLGTLSKDMARGNGETLRAFTKVLGCNAGSHAEVASFLQNNHQEIFRAPGAQAVLSKTVSTLKSNPQIASQCTWLI